MRVKTLVGGRKDIVGTQRKMSQFCKAVGVLIGGFNSTSQTSSTLRT